MPTASCCRRRKRNESRRTSCVGPALSGRAPYSGAHTNSTCNSRIGSKLACVNWKVSGSAFSVRHPGTRSGWRWPPACEWSAGTPGNWRARFPPGWCCTTRRARPAAMESAWKQRHRIDAGGQQTLRAPVQSCLRQHAGLNAGCCLLDRAVPVVAVRAHVAQVGPFQTVLVLTTLHAGLGRRFDTGVFAYDSSHSLLGCGMPVDRLGVAVADLHSYLGRKFLLPDEVGIKRESRRPIAIDPVRAAVCVRSAAWPVR